jgi:hypothetical protein
MRHGLSRLSCAVLGIVVGAPAFAGCYVREPEREVYVEHRHDRGHDHDRDDHPRGEKHEHREGEQH